MNNSSIYIVLILILSACAGKKSIPSVNENKSTLEKVSIEEIDTKVSNLAYDLGKRLLESCNTSRFKQFTSEEATPEVIANATKEKISSTCQKIRHRNGEFIGLKLLDIIYNNEEKVYMFHYDIDYEKKLYKRHLYVTINAENKVSSIKTREIPPKPL